MRIRGTMLLSSLAEFCLGLILGRVQNRHLETIADGTAIPSTESEDRTWDLQEVMAERRFLNGKIIRVAGILYCDQSGTTWIVRQDAQSDPLGGNVNWMKMYRLQLPAWRLRGMARDATFGKCIAEGKFGCLDLVSEVPYDALFPLLSISWSE